MQAIPVFRKASFDVIRYTDIECPIAAFKDLDIVDVQTHHQLK